MLRLIAVFAIVMLVACTTGERISDLRVGMNRSQVVSILGDPDGVQAAGNKEVMMYTNRIISGWNIREKADYRVALVDDKVTAFGPVTVRTDPNNVGVLMVAPIR